MPCADKAVPGRFLDRFLASVQLPPASHRDRFHPGYPPPPKSDPHSPNRQFSQSKRTYSLETATR